LWGTAAPDRSSRGGFGSFWVTKGRLLMCRGRWKRWYEGSGWGRDEMVRGSRGITHGGQKEKLRPTTDLRAEQQSGVRGARRWRLHPDRRITIVKAQFTQDTVGMGSNDLARFDRRASMKRIQMGLAVFLLAGTVLVWMMGCGSDTATKNGDDPDAASRPDGTRDAGSSDSGSAACPFAPPSHDDPCTTPSTSLNVGEHCTWGDDPRPECRTTAVCGSESTWRVTSPNEVACATPPLPEGCETPAPTAGTECSDATLACWYEDGQRCWCSECEGGTQYPVCRTIDPPQWACATPPDGCPPLIPQAGSACTTPGLSCGPSCETEVVCEDGVWVWRQGNCPVCAAPTTRIATPTGERAIATLRPGDLVYSVHRNAVVAVPILRTGSTLVGRHQVVRVALDGGPVLEISAGHPTADGRVFGDLRPGAALDGHRIVAAEIVPYRHSRTFDILPDSTSGTYFAEGALIGSTLDPHVDPGSGRGTRAQSSR
jgi:hypothetical protein